MSWFYIGKNTAEDDRMQYTVVHEFNQVEVQGNPMLGAEVQAQIVPKLAIDLQTFDKDEAAARCNYLNGGLGHIPKGD